MTGSSSALDGGQAAIAGFVYQALATASLRVLDPLVLTDKGYASMLVAERSSVVFMEHGGQDATVATAMPSGSHYAVLQMKFANNPAGRRITADEIVDIANKLAGAPRRLSSREDRIRYVLVTNRGLTGPVQQSMRTCDVSGLGATALKKLKVSGARVLRKLEYCLWDQLDAVRALEDYAMTLGSLPQEIHDGLWQLIGEVLGRATGSGALVTEELLRYCFTKHRGAVPLSSRNARESGRRMLAELARIEKAPGEPIPRPTLVAQIRDKVRDSSIVAIRGSGGCGKTTVMIAWAKSELDDESGGIPFIEIKSASQADPSAVTTAVSRWGGYPHGHPRNSEKAAVALDRLWAANPQPDLSFVLGVDDVESAVSAQRLASARDCALWAVDTDARGPEVSRRLVLTLRGHGEAADFLDFAKGLCHPESDFAIIDVGNFDPEELGDIALTLEGSARELMVRALDGIRVASKKFRSPREVNGGGVFDLPSVPDRRVREVAEMLLHPVILHSFLALPQSKQVLALRGESAGVIPLCQGAVGRFCDKAAEHVAGVSGSDHVFDVLRAVAIATASGGRHEQKKFLESAVHGGHVDRSPARALWDESLGGGIIAQDSRTTWFWCHDHIAEWLTSPGAVLR